MTDQENDKFEKECEKIINDLRELIMSNNKLPDGCDVDPKLPCCASALSIVLNYILKKSSLPEIISVIYRFINAVGETNEFEDVHKFIYYKELTDLINLNAELQKKKIIKDKLERLNSNLDKSEIIH